MDAPALPPGLPSTPPALNAQAASDTSQLQLLSVFHYVVAGIVALFSLFPGIYVVMGLAIVVGEMPMDPGQTPPPFDPRLFGWLFVAIGAGFMGVGLLLAAYMAYAGRCLARRRRHLLCMVVAGLACCFMPFGTVLGVFTLVVLSRPSVRESFQRGGASA